MKKILAFALTLCMLVALFATVASADSGTVTIKAAHHTAVDSTFNYGFELFKDKIEELSDGKMVVEIYPAGQLGDQTELIQQLQSDTIQMMISSCADVANFAPVVGVLDVPYMFETKQQAWNAMDGEAGEFFNNTIKEKLGVYCCGWWSGGTRSVFSSVAPIVTVDDMANLKIRTQPADVHVNSFTALGATVTPIAYTELYSALQQKVVDAAENDPSNYYSMKFYEVCKYYSLTEHIQQVAGSPVMVSTKFYDGLTDEQRAWFDESLHPLLVQYLVSLFNNPDINKNNAQLIVSTHTSGLMNLKHLRRDQIYFVEKDNRTGCSTLYSLDEFSPRTREDIQKAYLLGRYGSIPNLGTGDSP